MKINLLGFALVVVVLQLPSSVDARSWTDIDILHEPKLLDTYGASFLSAIDPNPSSTTTAPTESVSLGSSPSAIPLSSVTPQPTATPTSPLDPFPPIQTPLNPDPWYFNYDTRRDSKYGPGFPSLQSINGRPLMGYNNNAWGSVTNPPRPYWMEFTEADGYGPWQGVLQNRDVLRNMCSRVGLQSPIDIKPNGAQCTEHHQVRSRPGDFRLKTPSVMKQILPNKLRLLYQRRDCPDLNDPECAQPDPPKADFPNGWGGFADAMHIDFKLPSEHLIDGKRYDGEMQIYHLHPERRRFAVQVALIKATMTGYNYYFEDMLQSFENQYTLDRDQCIQSLRRHRQLMTEIEVDKTNAANGRDWNDYILKHATVTDSNRIQRSMSVNQTRQMQTAPPIGVWNPHHEMMVPSIHFWRYDGSMTDPPCGEFVSWFISDKAMEVSFEQLDRMKRVLFTHISKDCEQTSVHFEQSVARPVQATAERPVWHCTSADFGPDEYVPATS